MNSKVQCFCLLQAVINTLVNNMAVANSASAFLMYEILVQSAFPHSQHRYTTPNRNWKRRHPPEIGMLRMSVKFL